MSCVISTDDGYMKVVPYSPEMLEWEVGNQVELYHSSEKWTASYRIVHMEKNWSLDLEPEFGVQLVRLGQRVWDSDAHSFKVNWTPSKSDISKMTFTKDLSDQIAKDIQAEMDKEIIEELQRITGYNLDKRVKP